MPNSKDNPSKSDKTLITIRSNSLVSSHLQKIFLCKEKEMPQFFSLQRKLFVTLQKNHVVMERIYEISRRLVESLDTPHYRYLYDKVEWGDRLIMIKGARGVGKTTMLYQQCREKGEKGSMHHWTKLFFNENTIVDLADYHYKHGGTHLYLDEVHLYPRPSEQELRIFMTATPASMWFSPAPLYSD